MLHNQDSSYSRSGTCRLRRSALRAVFTLCSIAGTTLLVSQPAFGQETGSISGTVLPIHEHGLSLATARIPNLALQVAVEKDGTFSFGAVRPGSYIVEVRVPTLGTGVERVTVTAGQDTAVEIEVSAGSHFEEVVVSATGEAREQLELANAVSNLSGQELLLRMEASLGETLAQEPGVSSSFFGPAASRPIIRGLSGDRVRVLESGIGSGDASAVSADHSVTMDPVQAERIEVLRGPATLLYGSSAIGGAVNIIDERIPTARAAAPLSGTADLRIGTVSDERVGAVKLGGGSGEWAWHVDAMRRETGDYESPEFVSVSAGNFEGKRDIVPNSDLETVGGRLGATRFFGDGGFLGAAVSTFDSNYGLPEGGELPVRIDMEQRRFDLRAEVRRDLGIFQAIKVRLGATDYQHAELVGDVQETLFEPETLFFNDYLETRVELIQKARGNGTGSVGLQFSDRDLEAVGDEAFIPQTDTQSVALFTFQEIDAGPLRWQVGARFEDQENDAHGIAAISHSGLSGSVGLVLPLGESWSLGASLARSVKLPNAEELFSDGPHAASGSFEIGRTDLRQERALGLDISLRKAQGRFTGELTVYRQDFDNFIYQTFRGDVKDDLPVLLWTQADAALAGAELQGRVELLDRKGHHLHFEAVADVVRAELDAGGDLPRIPPMSLGGGLHYHSEHWSGNLELRWVDDQDRVAANETTTEGHTFVNASVGRRFLLGGQILDLLLRGRNLTDEAAITHTSFLKESAPLPGRDIALSARLWF